MSHWIYLECRSHEPPISSGDEITQHGRGDVYMRAVKALRERDAEALPFIAQHPNCEIGFVDEYGERWSLADDWPYMGETCRKCNSRDTACVNVRQQLVAMDDAIEIEQWLCMICGNEWEE